MPPPPRTLYLTAYNLLSATLWTTLFLRTLSHLSSSPRTLFTTTSPLARWTQTAALLDILHAGLGLVSAPVGTTALQVVTRAVQVWLVWYVFGDCVAESRAYAALLLVWAAADAVRYVYLALRVNGVVLSGLGWLRYSMFYPLYPVGIAAEWWLLYRAVEPAREISGLIPPVFYFLLALYVPGAYTMYTYMMKQRRKALGPAHKRA